MTSQDKTSALFGAGFDTSPSVVTALLQERPAGMTLPTALVDVSPKLANRHRKPSKPDVHTSCASRKAASAGRQDSKTRPTSHGPSAAEVWGQSLAEWRASNSKGLSVTAPEFVPIARAKLELEPVAAKPETMVTPATTATLDSRAPPFVPTSAVRKLKPAGSRVRTTPKPPPRAAANPACGGDELLLVRSTWWHTLRAAEPPLV